MRFFFSPCADTFWLLATLLLLSSASWLLPKISQLNILLQRAHSEAQQISEQIGNLDINQLRQYNVRETIPQNTCKNIPVILENLLPLHSSCLYFF